MMPLPDLKDLAKKPRKKAREKERKKVKRREPWVCLQSMIEGSFLNKNDLVDLAPCYVTVLYAVICLKISCYATNDLDDQIL